MDYWGWCVEKQTGTKPATMYLERKICTEEGRLGLSKRVISKKVVSTGKDQQKCLLPVSEPTAVLTKHLY